MLHLQSPQTIHILFVFLFKRNVERKHVLSYLFTGLFNLIEVHLIYSHVPVINQITTFNDLLEMYINRFVEKKITN